MKKILFIQLVLLVLAANISSQVKVHFRLANPVTNQGIFSFDVIADVQAGQQWKPGPTNIRIGFTTTPANAVSVIEDNPATNANLNISNTANYDDMTTTGIMNNTTISLNILQLYYHYCYTFAGGSSYTLGSIRFNVLDSTACINTNILPESAIFDTLTALTYNSLWTKTDLDCTPIGIKLSHISTVPMIYKMYQNYPNPFNPTTTIKFDIPKTSNVKIEIFDLLGRRVESLVNRDETAGTYVATWNATNFASGIYFYRITAGDFVATKKMLLIK